MEEKYNFKEKQFILMKQIQKRSKTNYTLVNYSSEINDDYSFCWFCKSENKNNKKFCSLICEKIFNSNNVFSSFLFDKINCFDFSLFCNSSKKKFKDLIDKYESYHYDDVKIIFEFSKSKTDLLKFKKITLNIFLIKHFNIILNERVMLEILLLKIDDDIKSKLNFIDSPSSSNYVFDEEIKKEYNHKCLYCEKETPNSFVLLPNNFIIPNICSVFCFRVLLYLNYCLPYKNKIFIKFPSYVMFKDKTIINEIQSQFREADVYSCHIEKDKINVKVYVYNS